MPEDILEKYGNVTLAIDIMAINKIPFVITTSRHIHFGTAELIHNKSKKTIMTSIQQVMRAYHARGFRVCNILGDGGFECIRNNLADMGITLNVASRNEHVPEVKRYIRTINERVRAIAPFKKYPLRLIAEMVYNAVFWLNTFPHNEGIHATNSPRTLITGLAIDYHKHCKLAFGTYVQVHEEVDSTLRPRTSGAIALRLTGNEQGGHYFLSLHSGKRLNRYAWTQLPMPNEVIAQIHCLAAATEKYDGIVFTDIKGNVLTEQLDDNGDTGNDEHTIASEATENTTENYTEEQYGNNHINDDVRSMQSGMENENKNDNTSNDDEDLNRSDQLPTEDGNKSNDDSKSVVNTENTEDTDEIIEDPYEQHITIDDINVVTEMNTSRMATQQIDDDQNQVQTHGYNLRSQPTK